jgi:hypothetical protein
VRSGVESKRKTSPALLANPRLPRASPAFNQKSILGRSPPERYTPLPETKKSWPESLETVLAPEGAESRTAHEVPLDEIIVLPVPTATNQPRNK